MGGKETYTVYIYGEAEGNSNREDNMGVEGRTGSGKETDTSN